MIFDLYICVVLHPRHKLEYFKNAGWENEWVDTAEGIVRAEFDKSYGSLDASWAEHCGKQRSKTNVRALDHFLLLKSYITVL